MYFSNLYEPMQICDRALKLLNSGEKAMNTAFKDLEFKNKGIEEQLELYDLARAIFEYKKVIREVEDLKQYLMEKMYEEHPDMKKVLLYRG